MTKAAKKTTKKVTKKTSKKASKKDSKENFKVEKEDIPDINITHAVILNAHPYYILSHDEESAIEISENYRSSCIGIIVAPAGLSMKTIQTKTILADIKMRAIPHYIKTDDGNTIEEVAEVDSDELDEDETAILDINTPIGE